MIKVKFIVFLFLTAFLNSAEIRIIAEINRSGLMIPDESGLIIYDQNMNVTYKYSYDGQVKDSCTIDFMPKGERCDWIIKNSIDGFYLFSKSSSMIYQTDKDFNLITKSKIQLDQEERLYYKFYENSLQNLVFFDTKGNGLNVLSQGELKKIWNEPETPDEFLLTNKRVLFIYDEDLTVKDENGIRYRSLSLRVRPQLSACFKNKIVVSSNDKVVVHNLDSGSFSEFNLDLPTGNGLALSDHYLLYSTNEKIFVIKLDCDKDNE